MAKENDPLDGYRARTEQDEENEVIAESLRGLAARGIDEETVADVIASEALIAAMSGDTVIAKLVTHCALIIKTNSYKWSISNAPATLVKEHLETRAARLLVEWIESIVQTGQVAEQLIKQQDTQHGK